VAIFDVGGNSRGSAKFVGTFAVGNAGFRGVNDMTEIPTRFE